MIEMCCSNFKYVTNDFNELYELICIPKYFYRFFDHKSILKILHHLVHLQSYYAKENYDKITHPKWFLFAVLVLLFRNLS